MKRKGSPTFPLWLPHAPLITCGFHMSQRACHSSLLMYDFEWQVFISPPAWNCPAQVSRVPPSSLLAITTVLVRTLHDDLLNNRINHPKPSRISSYSTQLSFKKYSHFSHSRALKRTRIMNCSQCFLCLLLCLRWSPFLDVLPVHFWGSSTLSVFQCLLYGHQSQKAFLATTIHRAHPLAQCTED